MNKLLLSLVAAVLLVTNSFAQVAPSFKYQGVARNAANAPLVNHRFANFHLKCSRNSCLC